MSIDKLCAKIAQRLEDNTLRLPNPPSTFLELSAEINSEDSSLDAIVKIIQKNPSIAVRLIRVANSAAIRPAKPISTVRDAIISLGSSLVKNLVFCIALKDRFSSTNSTLNNLLEREWVHSVKAASVCSILAPHFKVPKDKALMAGIAHGIGSLPIIDFFADLDTAEGIDVALKSYSIVVGRKILTTWQLPFDIVDSVAYEERHGLCGKPTLHDIIFIAHKYLASDCIEDDLKNYGFDADSIANILEELNTKSSSIEI